MIHNTLARETGRNLVYVPFPVKADRVGEAVRGARALSIGGLNVTVPHKSAVIPYLASVEREAELIGAVNTLVPEKNGYRGCNTDLTGLGRALSSEGVSLKGERVILLGAGGAARAAVFSVRPAGREGGLAFKPYPGKGGSACRRSEPGGGTGMREGRLLFPAGGGFRRALISPYSARRRGCFPIRRVLP